MDRFHQHLIHHMSNSYAGFEASLISRYSAGVRPDGSVIGAAPVGAEAFIAAADCYQDRPLTIRPLPTWPTSLTCDNIISPDRSSLIPRPISFSYPTMHFHRHAALRRDSVGSKQRISCFSGVVPGFGGHYSFSNEDEYMKEYSTVAFAITKKKAGWDCMRHYEIIAAGAIPYFLNLGSLPPGTMSNFPTELVKSAMGLPGVPSEAEVLQAVSAGRVPNCDSRFFNFSTQRTFYRLRNQIVAHMKLRLLTKSVASNLHLPPPSLCSKVWVHAQIPSNYPYGDRLFDYQHATTIIGLLEAGYVVHTNARMDYLSENASAKLTNGMYGRGFTIARSVTQAQLANWRQVRINKDTAVSRMDAYIITLSADGPAPTDLGHRVQRVTPSSCPTLVIDGNDIEATHAVPPLKIDRLYRRELNRRMLS